MLARAVASEVLVAIGQLPELPSSFITPGPGGLLSIKMTQAANYYGVRGDVVGRRTRLTAGEIRYGERPAVSDSGNLQLELREGKRRRPTMATSE